MKKLLFSIYIFSLALFTFAQTNNENKNDGQLENQIKQSDNFYINSDGLVVYKRQGDANNDNKSGSSKPTEVTSETKSNNSSTTNNSQVNSSSNTVKPTIIKKEVYNGPKETNFGDNNEPRQRPTEAIESNNYNIVSSSKNQENKYITPSNTPIKKEAITANKTSIKQNRTESDNQSNNFSITNNTSNKQDAEEAQKKYRKYGSYEKKQPEYKTIAEAALAIDDIIADLKKSEKRNAKPNSMSSRLSQGANRVGFSKKPLNSSYTSSDNNNKTTNSIEIITYDEDETSWGSEPTYYINGYEVDRSDIDLLKKKDIVNKEFKIRNTISGNPNGEVWYEVTNYNSKN